MENLDIHLEYKETKCGNFTNINGGKEEVSIIIMPLRIVDDPDKGMTRISTGCNMWKNCHNSNCQFSGKTYGPKT
jgi:hypothetical protein